MNDRDFSPISDMVRRYSRDGYFPDAVVAVFDARRVLYMDTCGAALPETRFDLASLTKLFTATAVLQLVQGGRFGLEASAADVIGAALSPRRHPALLRRLKGISVRALLTHTSGLLPWYPFYTRERQFFDVMEELAADNAPLPGMNYSDLNFMLLGRAVELQTGLHLAQVLPGVCDGVTGTARAAFLPKGSALAAALLQDGLLVPSSYGNGIEEEMCAERGLSFAGFRDKSLPTVGQANDGNCWYYCGGVSGHAGLFAPAAALVRLGQLYLGSREGILLRATEDAGFGRGLGFELGDKYPQGCGHTGFTGTSLWISHKNRLGVALLANRLAYVNRPAKDLTECRRQIHARALDIAAH